MQGSRLDRNRPRCSQSLRLQGSNSQICSGVSLPILLDLDQQVWIEVRIQIAGIIPPGITNDARITYAVVEARVDVTMNPKGGIRSLDERFKVAGKARIH